VCARDGAWLDPAASPPLRELLGEGEVLSLGERHVVLALPDGQVQELLERMHALVDALPTRG